MIQRLSHTSIYVFDQDAALDFYVNKLGFEVRMDQIMENGFRWLTVSPNRLLKKPSRLKSALRGHIYVVDNPCSVGAYACGSRL
jgi:catechol 2,3-dioxygenase-like lactoylglutathione lyase family enzyme